MITRKPSKIIDSVVNSSHEEHLNVSKGIRDDAPITNLTTCVKSLNFEASDDGSYILRKPLILKNHLTSITNPVTYPFEFYLSDKEHKVTVSEITEEVDEEEVTNRILQIPGASKIILKFYDNDMIEHKIEFNGNSITINWLTINSTFNTSDHTIINGVIKHTTFLGNYSYQTLVTRTISKWAWTLVNATHFSPRNVIPNRRFAKTITNLKRFIKIYESVDEANTFIIEIVHPELNTFTSGLDVGNTEALATNLLLDNPYAIRDLYGYGYLSVTKIVPYILKDTINEESVGVNNIEGHTIWDLTENDFVPSNEPYAPTQDFRMLISTNPNVFNKKYLILKAFLTTAVSNVDYYCCWEESKNGGIDWEVCQEFIDKFELTEEDEQTVSDLTAKDFNEMVYKESLTEAQTYIVKKKLYHMAELKTEDYHQDDYIEDRPDVLVLENPDLSKLYRFTIYINSNTPTPDPSVETHSSIIPQFDTLSGDISSDGKIKYEVVNADGTQSTDNSLIQDRCILLEEGGQSMPEPPVDGRYSRHYPIITSGKLLHIYTNEPLVKIKSVTYTLAPSTIDTSVTPNITNEVGALVGISSTIPTSTELTLDSTKATGTEDSPYEFTNLFNISYTVTYTDDGEAYAVNDGDIIHFESDSRTAIGNLWQGQSSNKTVLVNDSASLLAKDFYISNIFNCLFTLNVGGNLPYDNYPQPFNDSTKWIIITPSTFKRSANHNDPYNDWASPTRRIKYIRPGETSPITMSTNHVGDCNPVDWQNMQPSDLYDPTPYLECIIIQKQSDGTFLIKRIGETEIWGQGDSSSAAQYRYWRANNITVLEEVTAEKIIFDTDEWMLDEYLECTAGVYPTSFLMFYRSKYTYYTEDGINPYRRQFSTIVGFDPSQLGYLEFTTDTIPGVSPDTEETITRPYGVLYELKGIEISSASQAKLKIQSLTVTYTVTEDVLYTSVYMTSISGSYQVPYSNTTEVPVDLTPERDKIFAVDSNFYYNENQMQLLVYNDRFVYSSGTNSAVMKLMNGLTLPEEVTKIISWRGYLLLFSPRNIYLAKYNSAIDGYDLKVLSNTVGVSKIDADTITPILNSVYFKSGNKIYKLVPNLYAASDDILNIHQISTGVNNLLEEFTSTYTETHNFSYADADTYMIFIPIQLSVNDKFTMCICYDFNKQIWTLQKYPVFLQGIEKFSSLEVYVKDDNHLYYFKDSMSKIMAEARGTTGPDLDTILRTIKYADYLTSAPTGIISRLSQVTDRFYDNESTPIHFEIDFGQKSSNYTLDKQFLETKLIFATLSSRDMFPVSLDIYTDGVSRELHWDANTDGALWKDTEYKGIANYNSFGVLNTGFNPNGADYNGIFRQLIVKYSGKGKSIRHVISGDAKRLFKFYSMNVRARILPKKH